MQERTTSAPLPSSSLAPAPSSPAAAPSSGSSASSRNSSGGAASSLTPLALDALALVQNELLVSLRFMSAAFARLEPLPLTGAT